MINHIIKQRNKYNWITTSFLVMSPIIGILGTIIYVYFHGVSWQEPMLLISFWFLSGMGITMGYHRLFAHKSYQTNTFLEWVLMIFGSIALENTILKWSSDHRKHHTLAETEDDPYSITKGFWHAHIGWILEKTDESKSKIKGVKDLENKSAVIFQNKYYYHIAIIGGFCIPLLIGMIYGRPLGAVLWGTFLRITLVHHATFLINSLCHYKGRRTYDDSSTARDSWFVSLFTFGEGYHNYHHKFPSDFRNGVSWLAFDPSKWLISFFSLFGVTKKLIRTQDFIILRTKCDVIYGKLQKALNTSDVILQDSYNNRVESLFKSANEILLQWQEMDIKLKKNGVYIQRKLFRKYQKEVKRILKDLRCILRELSKDTVDISYHS